MNSRKTDQIDPMTIAVIEHLTGEPFQGPKQRRSAARLTSILVSIVATIVTALHLPVWG